AGPATETLERAEGDVLLVGHPAGGSVQLQPGGLDHPAEIDVPELLGGDRVALLELGDPDPDRGDRAHGPRPLTTGIQSPIMASIAGANRGDTGSTCINVQ